MLSQQYGVHSFLSLLPRHHFSTFSFWLVTNQSAQIAPCIFLEFREALDLFEIERSMVLSFTTE